jgi:hypothetical protein
MVESLKCDDAMSVGNICLVQINSLMSKKGEIDEDLSSGRRAGERESRERSERHFISGEGGHGAREKKRH